jgi:hypothetical protein
MDVFESMRDIERDSRDEEFKKFQKEILLKQDEHNKIQ